MGILEPMCHGEEVVEIGHSQEEQEERMGIYNLHVEVQTALVTVIVSTTVNEEVITTFATVDVTGIGSDDPPPNNNPSGPKGKIVPSGSGHGSLNDRMVMSGKSNGTGVPDTCDVLTHFLPK